MPRSPRGHNCVFIRTGRSYPPEPEPEYAFGDDAARDQLFQELSDALEAVDGPLAAAVADISTDDLTAALQGLPVPRRADALRPLGITLSRVKVGPTLAQDALDRLRRANDHDRRHACLTLTHVLVTPVLMAAFAPEPAEEAEAMKRLVGYPPATLRLTVWSNARASALGARVWLWASDQPWFSPEGVDPASLGRVVAAAQALADATPAVQAGPDRLEAEASAGEGPTDKSSLSGNEPDLPDADTLVTVARDTDTSGAAGSSDRVNPTDDPDRWGLGATADDAKAVRDRSHPGPELAENSGAGALDAPDASQDPRNGGDPAERLAQDLTLLESLLAVTTRAAEGLLDGLSAGWAPRPEHLERVATYAASFAALRAALTDAGADVAEGSLDGLRAALEHHRLQSDDQPLREDLVRFGHLSAPPQQPLLGSQLASAADRATALLDAATWTPANRVEAQTLALLLSLTAADMAPEEKVGVQQRVVEADPALALLAIQAGALVPALTEPTVTGPDLADPAATQPAHEGHGEQAEQDGDPTALGTAAAEPAPAAKPDDRCAHATPSAAADARAAEGVTAVAAAEPAEPAQPNPTEVPPAGPPLASADQADTAPEVPVEVARELPGPEPSPQQLPGFADAELDTVRDVLAPLIADRRYALAAEVARSCETGAPGAALLTTSALAAAVRTPNGGVAAALKAQLPALEEIPLTDSASLLLTVPALLRVALVTGDHAAGALLLDAQPHLEQHLATLAHEVGKRAVEGVLMQSPPLTWVSDTASSEHAIATAAVEAAGVTRTRNLRYKRASDIANDWLSSTGFIGKALDVVAADARPDRAVVAEALTLLSDPSAVSRQIETDDRPRRSGSSKELQGRVVGDLMSIAAEALNPLSRWNAAVEAGERGDRRTSWSTSEVAAMRAAVQVAAPPAIEALTLTAGGNDDLVAAAAEAAAASLRETVSLLDAGGQRDTVELSVSNVLGLDLLHVAGARVEETSGDISLPDDLDAGEFVAAASRSWEDSVRLHVAEENFPAARRVVLAAQSLLLAGADGTPPLSAEVIDLVSAREDAATVEVQQLHLQLEGALRYARLNSQISEEQDTELTARLLGAEHEASDPGGVRAVLAGIAEKLPHYRQEASARLRAKLDDAKRRGQANADDATRVAGFLDSGDLGTAEELIYLLQTNDEPLPSMRPHDELQHFFPAVPEALTEGITSALVKAVQNREVSTACPVLDFTGLSTNIAEQNAAALDGWRRLGATPAAQRGQFSEHDLLAPALRMVGMELKNFDRPDPKLLRHRDRRFVDVREVTLNGYAMVPAFGSNAGDRRRVLLVWGQPSAETLMSYVDQDPAQGPLIVAYLGTMSVPTRKDLTVRSLRSPAPVVVLDDAALAYLAARGGRLFETTMRILLPFANVNPYIRQKRGLVAKEMFYGRDDERRQVLDKDGTQIIYGGRGLGKSALLHQAHALFEQSGQVGDSVAVYMSLDALGIGAGDALGASLLWDALLQQLTDRDVVATKKARGARSGAYEKVLAAVSAWLGENPSRRLLILLDESDRFFEVDAPLFLETKRIRELGSRTQDRAKVVFAGLHSVQRFTKVAGNSPFSHLAQRPTVIGPLKPQHAMNLLTVPLEALGYKFEEPDQVNRVLANCSYQPFLLQMFGHRLVERMHHQRQVAQSGEIGMPYLITRADIDAVESNSELREDISNAFRETLHLDPRYNVIANVMARHAHIFGLDARLSDTELREECLEWWRDGFTGLDVEAFRAYLAEMVGLGVLARNSDGSGWRLRGPAVRDMVGLPSEVETQLLGAADSSLLEGFVALEMHTLMGDGVTRSPLTSAQMDDLIGDHTNQVRVVLGSTATGIAEAADAVAAAANVGGRFTVLMPTSRGAFESALVDGKPGERRVVVSTLAGLGEDKCRTSLESALTRVPDGAGVTRSTVLVADTTQLGFWRDVLAQEPNVPELSTVSLRRYDDRTLRVWALVADKFRSSERTERLLEVTGGWPFLVEQAARQRTSSAGEPKVLAAIEASLATPAGAADLIVAVGVSSDACVAQVYDDLVEMLGEEDANLADLQAVAADSGGDPETVVACLLSLGVLTVSSAGRYRLEPVLASAWRRR